MHSDDGEAQVEKLRLEELRQSIRIQKAIGKTLELELDNEYGHAINNDSSNNNLLNNNDRHDVFRYINNIDCWSGLIRIIKQKLAK